MNITFIGYGNVGAPLADPLQRLGHAVTLAARDPSSDAVRKARVVKAFSIYGFENFEDNRFPAAPVRPAMLCCGDDAAAKQTVGTLIGQLGWQPLDVGGLEQALHLEHMTLLWVRMVRMQGHSPHLVWAALTR